MFVVAMMLFLPAGTLRFWQGWAYFAVWFIPELVFSVYFYKRDPQLVERRLESKEKEKEQKVVMGAVYVVFPVAYLIAGLDFRFGWTHRWTGAVPLWLEVASLTTVLASNLMTIWVMDVNRYAARTIRVETGQKVVSAGPYKWVRHPMYFVLLMMMLATPLALGSYVALPIFALILPALMFRLLHEEKVLYRELSGYAEYCEATPYRLIPYIW
jgi:protein-S-isoprenylcysteine O-methyltransferase Ste14